MRQPRRRDVLRAGAAALAVPTVGAAGSAATTSNYAPRGHVDIDEAHEVVVGPDGEWAYVAIGTGFVTVDISDPANPEVDATRANLEDDEGMIVQGVADVKYDAGQLLVATGFQGGQPTGFSIWDVSDPSDPRQDGEFFPTPNHGNHNGFLHDGVAYLTAGLEVDIVDVSSTPFERLATWKPGDWNDDWAQPPNTVLHDLYVQGDYAYLAYWDGGTFVLDVSDPANPSFVSRVGDYTREELDDLDRSAYTEPGGNDHYVMPNDDASLMAEGGESWDIDTEDDSGGPSGITLFDISDKTSPERLGHIDPPVSESNAYRGGTWTTSHNFDIVGDRLYATWYQGGVSIHDIADPANPQRLAWWADPDSRAFWGSQLAVEGEFFVASSYGVNGATPGLFTFPDAAGEMNEPPASVAWSMEDLPSTTTAPTATRTTTMVTDEPTTEPNGGESTTMGDDETVNEDDGTTASDSGSGSIPGFGAVAALGGLGLGAARYLRSDDA